MFFAPYRTRLSFVIGRFILFQILRNFCQVFLDQIQQLTFKKSWSGTLLENSVRLYTHQRQTTGAKTFQIEPFPIYISGVFSA